MNNTNFFLSHTSNWEITCKLLQSYPKGKTEDGATEVVHRSMGKRRTSHQSSEHDLEEQINEWANMTWFLVALGGVCLQQRPRSSRPHYGPAAASAAAAASQSMLGATGLPIPVAAVTSTAAAVAAASASVACGTGQQQALSLSASSSSSSSGRGTYHTHFGGPISQEVLYCPVTQ